MLSFLILVYFMVLGSTTDSTQNNLKFIRALDLAQSLENQPISIPNAISMQRFPTLNDMGYVFDIISPLAQQFIDNEASADKSLLEIGAGFSTVSLRALQKGVKSYVANDMSIDHLKILVTRAKQHNHEQIGMLERLTLLHAKAPYELPCIKNQYDAILIDKVLHFMVPQDIEQFLKWTHKALKQNGKLYILTISPYVYSLTDTFTKYYEHECSIGNQYPGYTENVNMFSRQIIAEKNSQPRAMTFFTPSVLAKLLETQSFSIENAYTLKLPSEHHEVWQPVADEKGDLVAILAKKSS